jgi:aminoglycoside phosphotransferase (APT) family kinase protein
VEGDGPILAGLGLVDPHLLGTGIGSRVYEHTSDTVVKIHDGARLVELERLRTFYDQLAVYRFPFAVPAIHEIGHVGKTYFTIERRLPGEMLSRVLPRLTAPQRRNLLRRYLHAAGCFQQVTLPDRPFGQILAGEPIEAPTWRGFLERMIDQGLRRGAVYLKEDLGGAECVRRIERYFERELPLFDTVHAKSLVHGDYWPDNVLVDLRDDSWDVSAVLDFDGMTLVGDNRLDLAAAVFFLEMREGYPRRDSAFLLRHAVAQHGPSMAPVIEFYRLWYSAVYAHTKPFDSLTYGWCLANFRRRFVQDQTERFRVGG